MRQDTFRASRRPRSRWLAAGLSVLLAGCLAPTEVKQASSEVGVGLRSLKSAQRDFRDQFIDELEATRRLVGRAIVARAVVDTVNELSEQEAQGNLPKISKTIGVERDAWSTRVALVMAERPSSEKPEKTVERLVGGNEADALRESAVALEAAGLVETAAELRARATELDAAFAGGMPEWALEDLAVLVTLEKTKADVRRGLADLNDYLKFLQLVHGEIDEWIATDVTVSGAEVARLIERHAGVLGLSASADGGGS